MSNFILVDTNVWHFALVKPVEEKFASIHELAKDFLSSIMIDQNVRIALSSYQVSEVLEVLRRSKVNVAMRFNILEDFKKGKFFVKDLSFPVVESAVKDSAESNIHVYDYLVVYPLRGVINRIYSADEHFMHQHFRQIAEVVNPLSPWIVTEGRKPEKLT